MSLLQHAATATEGIPEQAAPRDAAIDALTASAYTIPTDGPEEDGTFAWESTTLLVVSIRAAGVVSLGYGYGSAAAARVADQAVKFAQSLLRGQSDREAIATTLIGDEIREMV